MYITKIKRFIIYLCIIINTIFFFFADKDFIMIVIQNPTEAQS